MLLTVIHCDLVKPEQTTVEARDSCGAFEVSEALYELVCPTSSIMFKWKPVHFDLPAHLLTVFTLDCQPL